MAGRKPMTAETHVQQLAGSSRAKQRMVAILETLQGTLTIPEACNHVGLKESYFHEMRKEFLQQAVELLEPRPLGRPCKQPDVAELRESHRRLSSEQAQLREELATAKTQVEVAAILGAPSSDSPKKRTTTSRLARRPR